MLKKNKIVMWLLIACVLIGSVFITIRQYASYKGENATFAEPIIYLYPLKNSRIKVKLKINGKITNDIPAYRNGWDVNVDKNGLIENKYPYLFYEADVPKIQLPKEAWVVKYKDLNQWFDINLVKLGLNN
jgi:hypothetical protein